MPLLIGFIVRALLVAAGLVLAAVLALLFSLVLALWLLRAAWARLTGRPVMPFTTRMGPRNAFEEMVRRAHASRTPRADASARGRGRLADVTDVEPK